MKFQLHRLTLVKRYLIGSLIVSIVPLALIAIMYDRYSSMLLNNLLIEKIDGDLETTTVKMTSFIKTQIKRLENLVDLPEIADVLKAGQDMTPPDRLLDFLYLEIGSPDIYGVEFFAPNRQRIGGVPILSSKTSTIDYAKLPSSSYDGVDIIGPKIPTTGAPGWFLIRKDVLQNGVNIGSVALRTRLASLTEQANTLYRPNIYSPHISNPGPTDFSVVGTPQQAGPELTNPREIMPGWSLSLIRTGQDIEQPRVRIRYILMIGAALTAIGVIWLFVHMSERLARVLVPLNEGARAIARGNFSMRVSEDGPGELKNLAQSFNDMSSHLNSMINSRVDVERRAALGNIAAGVAHEIRNPLTTVRTTIHGLKHTETDPERTDMFQIIIDEIMRVDSIIEEFLKYARPNEPSREPVPVREAFKSVKALTSASAHETGVKITLTGDSSLLINVDPSQFRQVLMNAVLNSLQAMPNGGHLTLRAQRKEHCAEISVSDTGYGINEDDLAKVVLPFYTTRKQGTGLGLAICAQLVRANGGKMEIESLKEIGTNLIFKLPLATSDQHDE